MLQQQYAAARTHRSPQIATSWCPSGARPLELGVAGLPVGVEEI